LVVLGFTSEDLGAGRTGGEPLEIFDIPIAGRLKMARAAMLATANRIFSVLKVVFMTAT
jgi:hypothetical protein